MSHELSATATEPSTSSPTNVTTSTTTAINYREIATTQLHTKPSDTTVVEKLEAEQSKKTSPPHTALTNGVRSSSTSPTHPGPDPTQPPLAKGGVAMPSELPRRGELVN